MTRSRTTRLLLALTLVAALCSLFFGSTADALPDHRGPARATSTSRVVKKRPVRRRSRRVVRRHRTPARPAPGRPASSATGHRNPALWPFATASPWNVPIGTAAQFGGTDDARDVAIADPGLGGTVNAAAWSQPVYQATTSDGVRHIDWDGQSIAIHVPAGAQISVGEDRNLHIIDPTGTFVDEMYNARMSGSTIQVDNYVRYDLRGAGFGQGGVRASGASAVGGLIRTWELQWGTIKHALAFAIPASSQRSGWVWPAQSQDSWAQGIYGGAIPMGSLFAIPRSVNLDSLGLSREGLVIAKALQQYGAYDVDSSDGFVLYAEPSSEGLLDGARNDIPKLRSLLQVVANSGPFAVGGGGSPTAPLAPG